MLNDKQKDALRRWYRQPKILDEARTLIQRKYWQDLEEFLQMRCLVPLGRTSELPDYMKKDDGSALLPNLNPRANQDAWEDATVVAWEVMQAELGITHDDVHREIGVQQKDDWSEFMKSVEERKRTREQPQE